MICRAEQRSAESASGDVGEIPFQRFVLRHLDCVEIVAGSRKRRALENPPVGCDGSVFAELKKVYTLGHRKPNIVTLGLFKE